MFLYRKCRIHYFIIDDIYFLGVIGNGLETYCHRAFIVLFSNVTYHYQTASNIDPIWYDKLYNITCHIVYTHMPAN